jgi:hypothetical protein
MEPQLFIGFPIDQQFESLLLQVNPHLLKWLIQEDNPSYLQYSTFEQRRYLGKKTGGIPDIDTLELLQSNVYSLLRRMIADYPYGENPLYIFPINPSA